MAKPKIELRRQRQSDAKRFFEILNNDNFVHFGVRPTMEEQRDFLKKNTKKRKDNLEYNFAILYDKKVVGAVGIKVNQHRNHIGEIGYFIDEIYWGKGFATKAVKLAEKIAFEKLDIKRIEIVMKPENKASEQVALKCGYKKEGLMKSVVYSFRDKKYQDVLMYSKVRL